VARQVIAVAPDRCSGWINQSYCLHEMKQTAQAMDCLLPLAMKFPKVSTIPYNLACYACQLGRIHEARKWLAKAAKIAGKDNLLPIALADPDLKPLWPEIEKNL
jgi:tetratricopeptide (TPR) repeat protein